MEDKLLRNAFQNKQYEKCIDIICDYIIKYLVTEIQNINKDFKYTNIFDLINASEIYLTGYIQMVAKDICLIQMGNLDDLIKISLLISIYKKIRYNSVEI